VPASIPSELNKHATYIGATNTAREENFTKIDYQNKRRVDWKEWNLMWMLLPLLFLFWKCPGRNAFLGEISSDSLMIRWSFKTGKISFPDNEVSTSIIFFGKVSLCAHDNTTTTTRRYVCARYVHASIQMNIQRRKIFSDFFKHSQKKDENSI
jgi:hypothetical protein